MTTEITESAKLAEEYYGKTMECSAHIESCAGKICDLSGQLSSFNTQLAASARKSLGNIRTSIDSLLSLESSSRPIDSIQTAIMEVEHMKSEQLRLNRQYESEKVQLIRRYERERVQLVDRCDQLLAFLRTQAPQTERSWTQAPQTERSDGMGQLPQQNTVSCDDIEPVADEVLLLPVPDSMNTNDVDRNIAPEPSIGSAATMPLLVAEEQCPTSFTGDALASDEVVSDSLTHKVFSQKNTTGVARVATRSRTTKHAAAGHVEPTTTHARRTSSSASGKSSVIHHCGMVNNSQGTSSTLQAEVSAPPTISLNNQAESTETELFKSPRPQSRGRMQVRQRNTVRTKSADSAVQSSLPSDTASSSEATVMKTGRYKRSKSVAQNNVVRSNATVAHQHNVGDVGSNTVLLQPATFYNPTVNNSQGTSSTLQAEVSAPPTISLNNQAEFTETELFKSPHPQSQGRMQVCQRNTVCTKSENSARTELHCFQTSDTASSSEATVAKTGRCKRSKSAAQNNVVRSNATAAHQHNVGDVVGSDTVLQPATFYSPTQQSSESGAVKTRRRRTKSSVVATSKKTQQHNLSTVVESHTLLQSTELSSPSQKSSKSVAVKSGRCRTKSANIAATKKTHQHKVSNVVGSDDLLQSAVFSGPSQESSKSKAVKTGCRRTKSAAPAMTEKTAGVAVDGKVVSCRGRGSQPHQLTGGGSGLTGGGSAMSAHLANVIQTPTNTPVTNINVNGAAATSSGPSRSVTTYLSGPRTDIFRQHSPQRTVSTEVAFGPAASTSVGATG